MAVSLEQLKRKLLEAQRQLSAIMSKKSNRERLVEVARAHLGTDASPLDQAPDYLACAETVTTLIDKVVPGIKWTARTATYFVRKDLIASPRFREVVVPLAGDIIISATGYGGKNGITHGHIGIYMGNGVIASNTSKTGTFDENFTLDSWKRYYVTKGGYELRFFRLL